MYAIKEGTNIIKYIQTRLTLEKTVFHSKHWYPSMYVTLLVSSYLLVSIVHLITKNNSNPAPKGSVITFHPLHVTMHNNIVYLLCSGQCNKLKIYNSNSPCHLHTSVP